MFRVYDYIILDLIESLRVMFLFYGLENGDLVMLRKLFKFI